MNTRKLTATNAVNFIHSATAQINLICMDMLQNQSDLKEGIITRSEYEEEKALLLAERLSVEAL